MEMDSSEMVLRVVGHGVFSPPYAHKERMILFATQKCDEKVAAFEGGFSALDTLVFLGVP